MKLYVEFNHMFREWPLAIATELQARIPGASIGGIAWQRDGVYERVAGYDNPPIRPLDHLEELERKWLATPCDDKRLAEYEEMLGPGVVTRIITAERNVSEGFITGARPIFPNALKKITRDHEMLRCYVLGLLDHVFGRLTDFRPDLVLCSIVDNGIPYTLGLACGHLNIKFAHMVPARLGRRYVIDDSPVGRLGPVRRAFEQALADPSHVAHLVPEARDRLHRFRSSLEPYESWLNPKDIRDRELTSYPLALGRRVARFGVKGARFIARRDAPSLRKATKLDILRARVSGPLLAQWTLRNGTFRAPGDLPARPFVYYPLHVDPEFATIVMAPMHTDQLAVVEALAKSIPLGMNLVVKEHRPMMGLRPLSFYKRLKGMPGVILASPFENPLSLIKRAALTCVITGSAAWEAIQLKRPALIIGEPPFLALGQGFVHCPDLSRLPEAVVEALKTPPVDDERLVLYIASVLAQSFDFPIKLREGVVTEETVRRHPEIVSTICDRLTAVTEG